MIGTRAACRNLLLWRPTSCLAMRLIYNRLVNAANSNFAANEENLE